jgi:hypothetical protein
MAKTLRTSKSRPNGIPRTAAQAGKHKFNKTTVKFDLMADDKEELSNWVSIANPKPGAVALIRRPTGSAPPARYFATSDPNVYIVCYYNPSERKYNLNCHAFPAGSVGSQHPGPE